MHLLKNVRLQPSDQVLSPHNSIKPNAPCSIKNMADTACHIFAYATHVGVTPALVL